MMIVQQEICYGSLFKRLLTTMKMAVKTPLKTLMMITMVLRIYSLIIVRLEFLVGFPTVEPITTAMAAEIPMLKRLMTITMEFSTILMLVMQRFLETWVGFLFKRLLTTMRMVAKILSKILMTITTVFSIPTNKLARRATPVGLLIQQQITIVMVVKTRVKTSMMTTTESQIALMIVLLRVVSQVGFQFKRLQTTTKMVAETPVKMMMMMMTGSWILLQMIALLES